MAAKKTTILVADDDPQALRFVRHCLQAEGYHVTPASDGQQALHLVETTHFDLLLLDIMMPRLSGLEVCEQVRTFSTVPIMVLTAREQVEDKAQAFELGADDYLTKPFSIVELRARVRALLRRAQWGEMVSGRLQQSRVSIGMLTIDFLQHAVTVDGRVIALTPIEYRILAYLAQNAGLVITHDLLLERVWGPDYTGENHLLKVNINRLRNKIEPDPAHPIYILTKPGVGYVLATSSEAMPVKERDTL